MSSPSAIPRRRYIADLLQVHLLDLAFVGRQRREALTSRRHTLREFGELGERLEAHLQGLLVAPVPALAELLQPQLAAPDRDDAFAAAFGLLRTADVASTHAVVDEFSRARGDTLAGLRDALSVAPPALFVEEMHSALDHAKSSTAVAAAVVLANHRLMDAANPRLEALLGDEDPGVAALAWRVVPMVDATPSAQPPVRPFSAALSHDAAAVREAAWRAAAWSGQSSALAPLRQRAASGDTVALQWLAALGNADDVPLLQKAALATEDPFTRCELLARFGHPSALNALVRWMAGDDVPLAVAARESFTRITGLDVRGERRTMPVPDDADDFDREMAPDVWMPDAEKARALLDHHAERWATGQRWSGGHRLDGDVPRELLVQLDLEARWDAAARAAMVGRHISAPAPIH